jgi:hypothetical protein
MRIIGRRVTGPLPVPSRPPGMMLKRIGPVAPFGVSGRSVDPPGLPVPAIDRHGQGPIATSHSEMPSLQGTSAVAFEGCRCRRRSAQVGVDSLHLHAYQGMRVNRARVGHYRGIPQNWTIVPVTCGTIPRRSPDFAGPGRLAHGRCSAWGTGPRDSAVRCSEKWI